MLTIDRAKLDSSLRWNDTTSAYTISISKCPAQEYKANRYDRVVQLRARLVSPMDDNGYAR